MKSPYATKRFHQRTICSAIALSMALSGEVHAGPTGGSIVGGDGRIDHHGGDTTITQSSERMAIDWESFNIEVGERVEFVQPTDDAIALNRVLGNEASHILGHLESNGQVILVNPNGVLFGEGAKVDVGGLVASGLDINPADFINGHLAFKASGKGDGFVINQGLINAASGGNVVLFGKKVSNQGLISAELGNVVLASGRQAVLTFDPQGLIGVRVTKETLQKSLGRDPAVTNSGEIRAVNGRVLLTASASEDVFSQAVNSGDLAGETNVLVHADGSFSLGKGASVVNTGEINVSGDYTHAQAEFAAAGSVVLLGADIQHSGTIAAVNHAGDSTGGEVVLASSGRTWLRGGHIDVASGINRGGEVTLLGKQVGLTEKASISATGGGNGGSIVVGGRGADGRSSLVDTEIALIGKDVQVLANGGIEEDMGNGGSIDVWSKHATLVDGHLEARPRDSIGVGGTITLASEAELGFNGSVAIDGRVADGTLVLEGKNLSVSHEPSPVALHEASLNNALAGGNLVLKASQSIKLDGQDTTLRLTTPDSASDNRLSLLAGHEVTMQNSEIILGLGDMTVDGASGILVEDAALVTGGHLNLHSDADIIASDASLGASLDFNVERPFAGVTAEGGGSVALRFWAYTPALKASGTDVELNATFGFASGEITADNLTISSIEKVQAHATVSGKTHLHALIDARFKLTGDYNLVTAKTEFFSDINLTDDNDLVFGDLEITDGSLTLASIGSDAKVSQAANTLALVGTGQLTLTAPNVELGSGGTSTIWLTNGRLLVNFDRTLSLDGLINYADYGNSVGIYGSDQANTVTVGEFAEFVRPTPEYEYVEMRLGGGDDTVNLYADLPFPITLGPGADLINLADPDVDYNIVDFDSREDTVSPSSP